MNVHGGALPLSEAAEVLRRHWAEWGELTPLAGEYDANFRVQASEGTRSILKVMHPLADPAVVDLQISTLQHLATGPMRDRIPRVIPWLNAADSGVTPTDGGGGDTFDRIAWRLSWLDGPLLAESAPWTLELCRSLGRFLGEMDRSLEDFSHFAAQREHRWDPAQGKWLTAAAADLLAGLGDVASNPVASIQSAERRARIHRICLRFSEAVAPRLEALPRQVIHADANDWNVLVDRADYPTRITGIFDFGDMLHTCRVCEPAVAAAYAAGQADDPMLAIAAVFGGYHEINPLTETEIGVGIDLVRMRLAVSATLSAGRRYERPDDAYMTVSEEGAWRVIDHLDEIHPRLATAQLRLACGLEPFPTRPQVAAWLEGNRGSMAPVITGGLDGRFVKLDLSFESHMLSADPDESRTELLGQRIDQLLDEHGVDIGLGLWDEARSIYLGGIFAGAAHPTDPARTVHVGADLFMAAGTEVFLPLGGVVESLGDNGPAKDYGPVVLFRHEPRDCPVFWTLWGHLDHEILSRLNVGDSVAAGGLVGLTGSSPSNGNWPPHPHIQIVLDPLDCGYDFPGVALPELRDLWCALSPNPAALFGLDDEVTLGRRTEVDELIERRGRRTGHNLSVSYRTPIHATRGWMQYLRDAEGRTFLDLYNNVPHVGHSHPHVADAIAAQSGQLATNTRYLSRVRLDYMDRLAGLFPDELDTVFLLNSATEANELALRMARAVTGRREVIVQDAAYHGHSTTLIDISPYKANGPGGQGVPEWVRVAAIPDPYRGRPSASRASGAGAEMPARGSGDSGTGGTEAVGPLFAADVASLVAEMVAAETPPGAFFAETMPSVGGQIIPPAGYLTGVYQAVRAAGGLVVADEVQTGFGRLGDWMWGFEQQGVVPDIVVLGKPMANGFPMGALVTRRGIADAFDTGMEFFSTFGGNPVACAAGAAMLDVLHREGLQANAAARGRELLAGLRETMVEGGPIGDVRGSGLFLGVEIVRPDGVGAGAIESGAIESGVGGSGAVVPPPWPEAASYIVNRLRDHRILAGTDGPHHNVIKLRGPMVVNARDVARFLYVWRLILAEPFLKNI